MYDVITIGAATYDVFLQSRDFSVVEAGQYLVGRAECVPLGAKIEVRNITFSTGGGATNAAVSFSRKGFKTAALVKVGTDAPGREVVAELAREGVATSLIQETHHRHTGYSVLMVTVSGERSVLVYRGASAHLTAHDIPWDRFESKWLYISSLGGNLEILETILGHTDPKRIKVAWNPGSQELHHGLNALVNILKRVDVLILNQEEAALLTGIDFKDTTRMLSVLRHVTGGIILLTRGAEGALVLEGKYLYNAGIFPEKVRMDRTGAGDAFGSGFVAGLMLDGGVKEGLRVASANATSNIEIIGAKTGLLTLRQLNDKRWRKLPIERRMM